MNRSIRWLITVGAAGILIVGGRMGWQDHVQAVTRQHAELALAHVPPVGAYPSGHEYMGRAEGLQCQVIVSVAPFHTMEDPTIGATVTGTFTLTYTGRRPAAITFYTLGGLPWPAHPSARILITAQGNPTPISPSPELPVTQVGPHRYLYQIVHWHHAQWPMTVQQTNREFRTTALQVDLVSGRTLNIVLKPIMR